jgi:hypothetical protein
MEWQVVKGKSKAKGTATNAAAMPAAPLTCAEVLKGFAPNRIEALIAWSRDQRSPVTGAPCHAQKHSVNQASKSSNYYGVLANTDRPAHSLTDDAFLELVVGVVLQGYLGRAVLTFACQRAHRGPQRIVFHLPGSLAQLGGAQVLTFTNAQYGGPSAAQDAVLIIDLDETGQLYVLTAFATVTLPPNARQTAGGRDCACINGQPWVWVQTGATKVDLYGLDGAVYFEGEKFDRRDET